MSDQEQTRAAEDRSPPPPPQTPLEHTPAPQTTPRPPEAGEQEQAACSPEVEELEDRWRRALADLDNLRKRYGRELPREREAERAKVAAAFLPVVDNLELALAHAGADDPGAIVSGVRAVRDQAVEVLRSLGYPRYEETGVPFDPEQHEVVSVVDEADTTAGTVVQVLRPGYGEPGHQLRPAAVAVSRKPE
ncbi:nucleotide exchange factor GrpE [Streptacidiphilus sp. PB12-B1b]|uniref:nucleotide exchange factor GrpE n=1 Tax=Streptacidiphilus sp. PB12-B1b TaxID=2705012 RepID=UPI0015FAA5DF|nr:nucleotide exchange factor GrpE [Streptacidiphilus sp. PB12-B1b]QMU78364.1 nucleotide exchange factor GrpE [Streptacidiphilus sp. PB12-B1b]